MNINKYRRQRYTAGATPVEMLPRLTIYTGSPTIYIKRDDLLGLTMGGNKTRKLEFLMADALEAGADCIITCGAVQSNHCRLTLAASIVEGMECHLVLEERVTGSYNRKGSGNNLLYNLLGAASVTVVEGGSDLTAEMEKVAKQLQAKGRSPYIIPGGGSNEIGALGYVSCAIELLSQLHNMNLDIEHIVVTSGSAGTHAGLLTGLAAQNSKIPVTGISISRKKEPQRELVHRLCVKTAAKINAAPPAMNDVIVFDDYVGEAYSLPTKGMVEAIKLLARTEAIVLDPVYTGKTMDGMLDLIDKGYFGAAKNVLFLHTGGTPATFAYSNFFYDAD